MVDDQWVEFLAGDTLTWGGEWDAHIKNMAAELLKWRELGRDCGLLATEPEIDREGLKLILEQAQQLLKGG